MVGVDEFDRWAVDVLSNQRILSLCRIVALTVPWRRGVVGAAILRIVARPVSLGNFVVATHGLTDGAMAW